MREFHSSLSPKGRITLPAAVRALLGIRPKDKVAIRLREDGTVTVAPAESTLASGYRSVPALDRKMSVEEMTEMAAEEHAAEAVREES